MLIALLMVFSPMLLNVQATIEPDGSGSGDAGECSLCNLCEDCIAGECVISPKGKVCEIGHTVCAANATCDGTLSVCPALPAPSPCTAIKSSLFYVELSVSANVGDTLTLASLLETDLPSVVDVFPLPTGYSLVTDSQNFTFDASGRFVYSSAVSVTEDFTMMLVHVSLLENNTLFLSNCTIEIAVRFLAPSNFAVPTSQSFTVNEDASIGFSLGAIEAFDDIYHLEFTINEPLMKDTFLLSAKLGTLVLVEPLNFTVTPSYTFS